MPVDPERPYAVQDSTTRRMTRTVGVRPDLVVEVRHDVRDQADGPMLVHGIAGDERGASACAAGGPTRRPIRPARREIGAISNGELITVTHPRFKGQGDRDGRQSPCRVHGDAGYGAFPFAAVHRPRSSVCCGDCSGLPSSRGRRSSVGLRRNTLRRSKSCLAKTIRSATDGT